MDTDEHGFRKQMGTTKEPKNTNDKTRNYLWLTFFSCYYPSESLRAAKILRSRERSDYTKGRRKSGGRVVRQTVLFFVPFVLFVANLGTLRPHRILCVFAPLRGAL